jgi:hypothetical protein
MKKVIFIAIAIMASNSMIAQEDDMTDSQKRMEKFSSVKKHEVSLDVIAGIAGLGINPRYEYVLGRYSGVGVDLNIGIADDDSEADFEETFSITPYYRQYFFSKEDYGAKGFYGEGFAKFYTFDSNNSNGNGFFSGSGLPVASFTEVAIGVGIGWKWVSESGFLIDLNLGIGRNLGIADDQNIYELPEITGRAGLNFGWRF